MKKPRSFSAYRAFALIGVQSIQLIAQHSVISVIFKYKFPDIPPKTPPKLEAALCFRIEITFSTLHGRQSKAMSSRHPASFNRRVVAISSCWGLFFQLNSSSIIR
jgi:hypothetical protein